MLTSLTDYINCWWGEMVDDYYYWYVPLIFQSFVFKLPRSISEKDPSSGGTPCTWKGTKYSLGNEKVWNFEIPLFL
jgi:hypothetical protein